MSDVLKRTQQDNQQAGYNYLINGDFRVNQRGEVNHVGTTVYIRDRWILRGPVLSGGQSSSIFYQVRGDDVSSKWQNGYMILRCQDFTSYGYIQQRVEKNQLTLNDSYTISALAQLPLGNMISIGAFWVNPSNRQKLNPVGTLKNFKQQDRDSQFHIEHTINLKDYEPGLQIEPDAILYVMYFFAKEDLSVTDFNNLQAPVFTTDPRNTDTAPAFRIGSCKMEKGVTSTPFEIKNVQEELARCQRYYLKHNTTVFLWTDNISPVSQRYAHFPFSVEMRTAPSITINSINPAASVGKVEVYRNSKQGAAFRAIYENASASNYAWVTSFEADAEL